MIPIRNIYYLLCYAWDKLEEGERLAVTESDYSDLLHLLTRVLLRGCEALFKRGLDRAYVLRIDPYPGVKGKINFSASLKTRAFSNGRAICEFDEFEVDILANQLLKATLVRVATLSEIERSTRSQLHDWVRGLQHVSTIQLDASLFDKVRIHRNNSLYGFLLNVCKLILQSTSLDSQTGRHVFKEFTGNDKVMAALFEAFLRNFYKRHRPELFRGRENIRWSTSSESVGDSTLLPLMQTDVTLQSLERKLVVDAKYYTNTLATHYSVAKLHSNNLYQIYSYLRNLESDTSNPLNASCHGLLLYPTVDKDLDQTYQFGSHAIRVATVNLDSQWREIERRLLSFSP